MDLSQQSFQNKQITMEEKLELKIIILIKKNKHPVILEQKLCLFIMPNKKKKIKATVQIQYQIDIKL